MSAVMIEQLSQIARAASEAGHGERQQIYRQACADMGISLQTLYRKLNSATVRGERKRRSDHGATELSYGEAHKISGYIMEHIRKNNKRIKPLQQAVQELRDNGEIIAGRIDPQTGELFLLSDGAIGRALRSYNLHPDQLLAKAPVTPLRSLHPNHVWQIDASLCVLYKMPDGKNMRIQEVAASEAYKNKLSKFAKIEHRLVQRYVITDHASGAVFLWYALGGESAESLCHLLIEAVLERRGFPFHGAPLLIMADQASANRSAPFRNLCKSLSIRLHYTQPGNPRSKGQVEKAHDQVEISFESGLKLARGINDVAGLNTLGQLWMHHFNGTAKHTRHGMTRYEAWMHIKSAELRRVNATREELLLLAQETPEDKKVTPLLTVNFKGCEYDVAHVPGVMVGQMLSVARCGWESGLIHVIRHGDDGQETYYRAQEKRREGVFGFYADSAVIGEEYKRHTDTPAQTAAKDIERLVTGATTDTEAQAQRKAKAVPFGGRIDPHKAAKEYQPPAFFRHAGTELDIPKPALELQKMSPVQMAKWLHGRLGEAYQAAMLTDLKRRFPQGATEPELEQALDELRNGTSAARGAKLRIV